MAIQGFVESFYLNSKLNQLQQAGKTEFTSILQVRDAIEAAGYTVEEHFQKYSLTEGTSPNQYFNTQEYLEAKAAQMNADQGVTTWDANAVQLALADAGYTNAYDHFTQYGFEEDVNPSNAFDVSEYLAAKAADAGLTVDEVKAALVDAGLNPVGHFLEYGQTEGLTVTEVPASEQVTPAGDDPDVEGKTFTLTADTNIVTGTSDDDRFIAGIEDGSDTLTPGDIIDGGAGTDRLDLIGDGNIAAFAQEDVTNVENIYARFDASVASQGLNVSANADVEQAWVNRGTIDSSGATNTVVTLTKEQTAGIQGTVRAANTGTDILEFDFSDATDAAGDEATLALSDADLTTTDAALASVTIEDIETLNIAAAGENVLGTLANAGNDTDTVNITGAGSLEATIGSQAVETVDASANEGGVELVLSASDANDQTITGGAGDDVIVSTWANLTDQDTVDLGAGQDAMIFTGAVTVSDATQAEALSNVSNVEVLGVNGAGVLTVDADLVDSAINTFAIDGTASAAITDAAEGVTLVAGAAATAAQSSIATKLGADTVNVALEGDENGVSDLGTEGTNDLTITGSSSVNISSTGEAGVGANLLHVEVDDNNTLNVTGDQDLEMTTVATGGNTGLTIDASDFGADLTVTGTGIEDSIVAGAGDDTINASAGTDSLTGGAGNDTFAFAAGITGTANMSTITDINSGDVLDFDSAAAFVSAEVDVSGAADLDAALLLAENNANDVRWFNFDGNTYVVNTKTDDTGAGGDVSNDTIVELSGVQDLSEAEFAAGDLTIA